MLPAVSLGCWHNFGGAGSDAAGHDEQALHDNARAMLFTAFDAGVTHFDLANNYGPPPGAAEERVGRILDSELKAHRDELVISTKAGHRMWPGPYGEFGSRKHLLESLDASLRRLRLDHVDIFYSHRFDPDTPLEETLGALDHAVKVGKAIYTGISNYKGALTVDAVRTCQQHGLAVPVIHQAKYHMLDRTIESDLLPHTAKLGLGVIAFCPLAQGLLTSRYLAGIPSDSRAALKGFLKPEHVKDSLVKKAAGLENIARQRGQTLAQLALAWVVRDERVTSALIGASRPAQVKENVAAVSRGPLLPEEVTAIEQALAEPAA